MTVPLPPPDEQYSIGTQTQLRGNQRYKPSGDQQVCENKERDSEGVARVASVTEAPTGFEI